MTKIFCGDALDIVPELPHPDLIYIDPPFFTQRDFESFDDRWASLQTYTDWLTGYCSVGWDALNPGGNFLIHLDWHAVHAMKVRLDHCFGGNFVNEIIWSYNSGGDPNVDCLANTTTFYGTQNLGLNIRSTLSVNRTPPQMQQIDPVSIPMGGCLQMCGRSLSCQLQPKNAQDTQPETLGALERIITIFSNEGDLVLDYFCGSGRPEWRQRSLLDAVFWSIPIPRRHLLHKLVSKC